MFDASKAVGDSIMHKSRNICMINNTLTIYRTTYIEAFQGAFSSVRVSEVWAINIIGHVSSRTRYDGSPSTVPHAAMLAIARRVL